MAVSSKNFWTNRGFYLAANVGKGEAEVHTSENQALLRVAYKFAEEAEMDNFCSQTICEPRKCLGRCGVPSALLPCVTLHLHSSWVSLCRSLFFKLYFIVIRTLIESIYPLKF